MFTSIAEQEKENKDWLQWERKKKRIFNESRMLLE
jgi:hypothetical protein